MMVVEFYWRSGVVTVVSEARFLEGEWRSHDVIPSDEATAGHEGRHEEHSQQPLILTTIYTVCHYPPAAGISGRQQSNNH